MKDTEHNRSEDDFEVEVSDIAAHLVSLVGTRPPTRLNLAPRFSPRQRALQGAITAGVVMLALLVIIGGYIPALLVPARGYLSPRQGSSTLPNVLVPGADLLYIQRTLSWSTVSLDGHVLSRQPIISSDAPMRLARGSHQFVWDAEPFEPISCMLSVPAAST